MEKSDFTNKWIIEHGVPIAKSYYGNLTIRALHYRLVADLGMTNDTQHYKKVVNAMIQARWDGLLNFDAFKDHERDTHGATIFSTTSVDQEVDIAKQQIRNWANHYSKNKWENQPIYPEVFIEKKALQGVFEKPCRDMGVALNPCKGYPSLTFLYDASVRFKEAISDDREPVILYFGDYDCSGEDIPRSIKENLRNMGVGVDIRRIALLEEQVVDWKLPPAPTKASDSRAANWDGIGQVELDAIRPDKLSAMAAKAIQDVFDDDCYAQLLEEEKSEKAEFKKILKRDFKQLLD